MKLDDAFGIHEHALKLRAQRTQVLAANLANADTPGFKARDVDFSKILAGQSGPSADLRATHSRHISTASPAVPSNQLLYRIPSQPSVDGNTVDPDMENMAFGQNVMRYQASVEFLNGKIKGLLSAIKGE